MKEEIAEQTQELINLAKREYSELADFLKRERDELKLQIHLASADAQDQWHKVDAKWEQFQLRAAVVAKVTEKSAKEVRDVTYEIGTELKEAYRHIRDTLK